MKKMEELPIRSEIQPQDFDSTEFREQTLLSTQTEIHETINQLKEALAQKDFKQIERIIFESADRIARVMLQADNQTDIYSTNDTAIMHSLGMILWKKPKNIEKLENENIHELIQSIIGEENTDHEKIANGIYFLYVLLQKYKNANGRTARALQLAFNKTTGKTELKEDDIKKVLGINKESITQTGKTSYKINFDPNFERLVLGISYFGIHKGLTEEQVVNELNLNGKLPEDGLKELAQKLQVPIENLREEFIKFMVSESDLGWCDFKQE